MGQAPILVINAGSSSIKFSVFRTAADRSLSPDLHGQVEGIGSCGAAYDRGCERRQARRAASEGGFLRRCNRGDPPMVCEARRGRGRLRWRRAPRGAWRTEVLATGAGQRRCAGGSGTVGAAGSAARAAPDRRHPGGQRRRAQGAPGGVFRHRVSSRASRHWPGNSHCRATHRRGIRRYGFHGLSYEYIVSVLPQVAPACARGKLIVAHLGNGASMCAIDQGRAVCSTMGLTAVDGLPMGTRSGTLDPGVLLYLMQHERMDAQQIEQLIYQRSGLLGVSGLSGDMRTLLASEAPAARGGRRPVRVPHRTRTRVTGGRAGWPGRAGVHRRHRRARLADPRARLPGRALDRPDAR